MNVQKEDILFTLKELGIKFGDIILVHSSLKSFGYVENGALTVIEALFAAVGPEGTIMVPSLTGKITDSREHPPVFDVRTTPCWTGKIPETFRNLPEARRSLHPTHSAAAIGMKAEEMLKGHEKSESPCDAKSPYYKNAVMDGYIMLIGCDQNSNTTIHCCEEIAEVTYHLQKEITEINITGYMGETILVRNRLHDWHKPPTDFNKFDELFQSHGIMKKASVGKSLVRLIKTKDMLEFAVDTLTKNPYFLLTDKISH